MAELLEQLRLWIEYVITHLGYAGIALVMLLENLFPPIPSELVMPFAGFLAAQGTFTFPGILLAGTIGSVLGAILLYYLGMWADEALVRRLIRRYGKFFWLTEQDFDRALQLFGRYGPAMVFLGRLIPLVRSLISIPAGMNRMPLGPFLAYTTLGSAIWNGLLGYTGMIVGENWNSILGWVDTYEQIILGVLALVIVVMLIRYLWQTRTQPAQETQREV